LKSRRLGHARDIVKEQNNKFDSHSMFKLCSDDSPTNHCNRNKMNAFIAKGTPVGPTRVVTLCVTNYGRSKILSQPGVFSGTASKRSGGLQERMTPVQKPTPPRVPYYKKHFVLISFLQQSLPPPPRPPLSEVPLNVAAALVWLLLFQPASGPTVRTYSFFESSSLHVREMGAGGRLTLSMLVQRQHELQLACCPLSLA
jgi:hypothetical protein